METQEAKRIAISDLAEFIGTEHYYSNPLFKDVRYTDGVQYLSVNGASWLVTDALAVLGYVDSVKAAEFVAIKVVNRDGVSAVRYEDGNDGLLFEQEYTSVNVPDGLMMFWYSGVLMLASEY